MNPKVDRKALYPTEILGNVKLACSIYSESLLQTSPVRGSCVLTAQLCSISGTGIP
jgi:hypothetical protein